MIDNAQAEIKATHTGELKIGNMTLLCHVLQDGKRVISGNAMQKSLGFAKNASGTTLKKFIDSRLLKYLSNETKFSLDNPIKFSRVGGGGSVPETYGYDATVLIDICDAIILADRANELTPGQKRQAEYADIIMRSVAKVGLVALIDEVTGYQEIRDRNALQAILDTYLAKELAVWAKRFPDEFYQQIFRLKNWEYNPGSFSRPSVVGRYTADLVYERLAPGLLQELQELNPKNEKGYRKNKHHQWLSSDIGHPALSQHIHAVIGFMRASDNWEQFLILIDKAYPKKGSQIKLLLPE